MLHDGTAWKKDGFHKEEKYDGSYNRWYGLSTTLNSGGGYTTEDANGNQRWEVNFELSGAGAVRRYFYQNTPEDGDPYDDIGHQSIGITNDDSAVSQIETSSNPSRIGGWPWPETTSVEFAYELFKQTGSTALFGLDDRVSAITDAYSIWQDMKSDLSSDSHTSTSYQWYWDYGSGYIGSDVRSDTCHFVNYDVDITPGASATHYIESSIATGGYGVDLDVNWKVTVEAPDNVSTASTSEKKKYGIRKVPVKALEKAGFHVAKDKVPDDKVWFASNIPITAELIPSSESPITSQTR